MKKGFTLVEIIGSIIILGIVVLLAVPQLLKLIKDTNDELDSATTTLIYTAASRYANDNTLKIENSKIYCVDIKTLISNDYLTANITDEKLGDHGVNTKIKISIENNKYKYEIDNECVEN